MSSDYFYEMRHISQTVDWNELKSYRKILDIWNYILVNFQIKWSSGTYYLKGSKLLDKSCQIYHTRRFYTVCDIFGVTCGILLRFNLGWK
jgi:hypothetical protein